MLRLNGAASFATASATTRRAAGQPSKGRWLDTGPSGGLAPNTPSWAAGIGLRLVTGSGIWDGAASIAIGALLVFVAIWLGLDSRNLLIGREAS